MKSDISQRNSETEKSSWGGGLTLGSEIMDERRLLVELSSISRFVTKSNKVVLGA